MRIYFMRNIKFTLVPILLLFSFIALSQPSKNKKIDLNVSEDIATLELKTEIYKGKTSRFKGIPSKLKNKNSQLRYAVLGTDTIFVIFGDLNKKERICIVDNDGDLNFANNFVFEMDAEKKSFVNKRPLAVNVKDKKSKIKQKVFVLPLLVNHEWDKLNKKEKKNLAYDINIGVSLYHTGHLAINGINYTLLILNQLADNSKYQYSIIESSKYKDTKSNEYTFLHPSQSVEVEGFLIEPTFITQTRKSIELKITDIELLEKSKIIGVQEGNTIPDFVTKDLNNRNISLANYRGNYLLIDFWGTWCDPCLKVLPRISNLQKKHPNLNIISVAFELEEKSIYKIPNFVREYEMNWPQVYELMQMPKGFLTFEFQVKKFPTTVLIDPDGIILHRGGEDSIDSLEEKLDELFSTLNS